MEGDKPAVDASGERTWPMPPPSSPSAPGSQGMNHTSHSENEPKPANKVWCVGSRNSVPYHSVRCQSCLPPCLLRQHPALIVQQKLRHKHTHTPSTNTSTNTSQHTQPFVIARMSTQPRKDFRMRQEHAKGVANRATHVCDRQVEGCCVVLLALELSQTSGLCRCCSVSGCLDGHPYGLQGHSAWQQNETSTHAADPPVHGERTTEPLLSKGIARWLCATSSRVRVCENRIPKKTVADAWTGCTRVHQGTYAGPHQSPRPASFSGPACWRRRPHLLLPSGSQSPTRRLRPHLSHTHMTHDRWCMSCIESRLAPALA